MTLIAMALSNRPPILTADILITSADGMADMKLPNRPAPLSEAEVKHLSAKPHRLLQKLYVIQPNICMCVAGRVYEIKMILEDFRNFCRWKTEDGKGWLSLTQIQDFFATYSEDVLNEVVLGIAVANDEENGFVFTPDIHREKWQSGVSDDFGAVLAAGSGAVQYLEHIQWHNQVGSSHVPGDFMFAKQVNFTFITKLLSKENRTLKSLEEYWGGFLELCYFNGEGFEKAGDVAFVISDADCDEEGTMGVPIPRLFIYSQYIENTLFLTTVKAGDFEITQDEESIQYVSRTFTKTLFAVEEIDAKKPATALQQQDDLSFFANQVALGLTVALAPDAHLPMSAYTEGMDVYVEFKDEDYIKLVWPVHLQEKQAALVKEHYPQLKDAMDGRNPSDTPPGKT